jgi:hypothetical protein
MMKKTISSVFIFAFLTASVFAQSEEDLAAIKETYKKENAVYLTRKESSVIKVEADGIKIYTSHQEEMLMLTTSASLYSERSISSSHFEKLDKIDAKTLVPNENGKGYRTYTVSNFKTESDISSGVFYDDYKNTSFYFPGMQKGARAILNYKDVLSEPRFFGAFFFSSYVPVHKTEFSVIVPSSVKINYKLFNLNEQDVNFTRTKSGSNTIYSWKMTGVKKFSFEDDAPNIRYYAPHVVVQIDSYTIKGNTIKLLSDVSALYSWYSSMVKDVNKEDDSQLKNITDSLVKDQQNELDKVKKIFYWVQDNIKYVAFEDGMGGFIPREASKICERRYGDCKDMASIITTMLKYAGIKAYLTWIGTRDIPYTYAQVPAPFSDNHMIATYISPDGKYYFLDGTGKNAAIDMPTSMIQGKEALIGKTEKDFEVVKVPEMPKETNLYADTANLFIIDNTLKGHGSASCTGYDKIRVSYQMQNYTEEDKLKIIKGYVQKGSNKFSVDSIKYSNLFEREKLLLLNYKFKLPDYLKINGNEMYLNMNLDKSWQGDLIDIAERTSPREMDHKFINKHVTVIEIPAGYTVTYIPESTKYENIEFGYEMKYFQMGNKLYLQKQLYIDVLVIELSDFEEWNKMIKQLNKAYNESIIIKKK